MNEIQEQSWKKKNCCSEDVFKTPSRRIAKQEMFPG